MWARIKSTLRNLIHKERVDAELEDEIRTYIEAATEEKVIAGCTLEDARRYALAECGGMEQVKQAVRDQRAGSTAESVFQDLRYGLRQLRRDPAFTWTAVITLALGIGATTAIFSAVYALLIRPLPYPGSNRLVEISEAHPKRGIFDGPLLSADFVAAQSSLRSFKSLAGFVDRGDTNLTGTGDPIRVKVVGITSNFLSELHVIPEKGRAFLNTEDRRGGPAVVILSHRLWQSKFDGDAAVIGRSIALNGKASTVVGVLPAHFIFPDSALEPDLYIPTHFDSETTLGPKSRVYMVRVIGRLCDGVSLQQAETELEMFAENRAKGYPPELVQWMEGRTILPEPLHHYLTGDDRKPLLILLACVGAVLLIACANVANLQLARSVSRQHEMAVRGALGVESQQVVLIERSSADGRRRSETTMGSMPVVLMQPGVELLAALV